MDANAQYELYLIKKELQIIINELDNISYGVRRDFSGIGSEKCSDCISNVANKYRSVKYKLDNINTSKVTQVYKKAHSEKLK